MKQTCILILGMHRSGTSALTGTLKLLDISLGNELLEPKDDNQKGFFENKNIVKVNEGILESLGAHWHDVFYTPEELSTLDPALRNRLKKVIQKEFEGSRVFAIKDPRLASLFPLYESILNELSIEMKIIIPYRNPIEVARSLSNRDKFTQEKAILLWTYNILWAEQFSRKYSRVFIEFDKLILDTEKSIATISEKLNLKLFQKYQQNRSSVDTFLEPSLKHHNITIDNKNRDIPNAILKILELDFNDDISDPFDLLKIEIETYRKLFYHQEVVDAIKNIPNLKEKLHQCNNKHMSDRKEIEEVHSLIDEKEAVISSFKNLMKESEEALQSKNTQLKNSKKEFKFVIKQIDEREQKLKEQSEALEQVNRLLQDKVCELEELHQTLTKQIQTIAYKDLKIQQQERDIKKSNEMIQNREKELKKTKKTIVQNHQIMHLQENRINRLGKELMDLYTSKSWKITRPLRKLARLWK